MINERTEFALRSLQPGINFSELCAQYGISRKTGYKWKDRFELNGAHGMADHSRRPHASPSAVDENTLCTIARLRERHRHWGPAKIRELYLRNNLEGPSESTFKRIFEKSGWVKKRKRTSSNQSGRICTQRTATTANEIWTVDFKGWWRTGDGKRCQPLTVRDQYSRFILCIQSMDTTATQSVRSVFEQLFDQYGLPQVIRSDNGVPFAATSKAMGLSSLSAWWLALGIDLDRTRPGKPQDNGAHERMHLDIARELEAYAKGSLTEQQAAFDIWKRTFNYHRPHQALGMKTPAQLYKKSTKVYHDNPNDIEYVNMSSRKVSSNGSIKLHKMQISISEALSGWSVGLKPINNDQYELYFAKLALGLVEMSSRSFITYDEALQNNTNAS